MTVKSLAILAVPSVAPTGAQLATGRGYQRRPRPTLNRAAAAPLVAPWISERNHTRNGLQINICDTTHVCACGGLHARRELGEDGEPGEIEDVREIVFW